MPSTKGMKLSEKAEKQRKQNYQRLLSLYGTADKDSDSKSGEKTVGDRKFDSTREVNNTTARNYLALLASQDKIHLAKTTVPKTNARFTAENSLMSAVSLLCVRPEPEEKCLRQPWI